LAATVVPEISETQCGFKFFDGVLARTIAAELVATGFAFDVELLARARRRVELLEIPVEWTDVEGSTFSPLRDGARAFRELSQIRRRVRALPALAPVAPSGSSVQIPAPRQPRIDLTAVDATPVR
jgi:hypothetical protein